MCMRACMRACMHECVRACVPLYLSLMLQLRQRLSELRLWHFLTTSITVSLLSSEMCRRSRMLRLRSCADPEGAEGEDFRVGVEEDESKRGKFNIETEIKRGGKKTKGKAELVVFLVELEEKVKVRGETTNDFWSNGETSNKWTLCSRMHS